MMGKFSLNLTVTPKEGWWDFVSGIGLCVILPYFNHVPTVVKTRTWKSVLVT